ncbi:hypothetical protein LIER_09137 [Lithospermum erythrorhizon]|uniref:Uncharacterized protein n=1 Tax=Lithospermum erythrorhizon TaxID=34254 RepID=A0AAV3PEG8_LITER
MLLGVDHPSWLLVKFDHALLTNPMAIGHGNYERAEEIFVSRDVKFHEGEFPFSQDHPTTSSTPRPSSSLGLDKVEPVGAVVYDSDEEWGPVPDEPTAPGLVVATDEPAKVAASSDVTVSMPPGGFVKGVEFVDPPVFVVGDVSTPDMGRGLRTKHPSVRLRDFVTHTTVSPSPLSLPSTVEAEYRSMAAVTSKLKWLKALLLDFGVQHSHPMTLFCDSQSALHIAQNPVFHEHTKHIEVDCHYVCDAIRDGLLTTTHVSTTVQLADIFTKDLSKEKFLYLLRKLGTTFLPTLT